MKEVNLPSGAVLKIGNIPFATSKALYQSVLREAKGLNITSGTELTTVYKDILCSGFSSPEIEKCLWECMKRCLYNEFKIDDQTFEPMSAREDYMLVCVEVAMESITPFTKGLSAVLQVISGTINKSQA